MSKKLSNIIYSERKDIVDESLLVNTPNFNIDSEEAQFGRNHDDVAAHHTNRKSDKLRKCKGSHCNKYFNK